MSAGTHRIFVTNEEHKAQPTSRELEDRRRAFLVLRAQVGDRSATEDLLEGTVPWLQPYLRKIVGDPDFADELVQEVLLKVYRNLVFLNEPRVYRSWVYRIATRHAFRRLLRRRRRRQHELAVGSVPEEAVEPEPPPLLEANELAHLRETVAEMPAKSRAVVALHYFEGLSIPQVAAVLDIQPGTVKSRLNYGLRWLRQRVDLDPAGRERQVS